MKSLIISIYINFFLISFLNSQTKEFVIFSNELKPEILVDTNEAAIVRIAAELLTEDIVRITGFKPEIAQTINKSAAPLIVIGTEKSMAISHLVKNKFLNIQELTGKHEIFVHKFIKIKNREALVICGSDNRGTAYGVFHLSEKIGISPWYWWADVNPERKNQIAILKNDFISKEPSVKYRGIFLNDEDWGLQPWAAKNYEPETGDIGPKTYARIFELLLRLKANTIWPAMHDCTKAFFHYPGNVEMAKKYEIVIGTSHAEPMLRNNVDEWKSDLWGEFNFKTNRDNVYRYWETRAIESKNLDAIYTIGMRGVHDSGIEGFKDPDEVKPALEQIIKDQRQILQKHVNEEVTSVPQVFIPYKEVLDIYDKGLILPEDITLMWTDDNYGYIRRLNSEKESERKGGSGVYYHVSYWGRPHDYLWLSTAHPLLIWEEMNKAWKYNAREMWILNVGDIKPAEYNMQLFLDMAYDMDNFSNAPDVKKHFAEWNEKIFGKYSQTINPVLWEYYNLAFERKPEFMGWSRTEPSTATQRTAYNHFFYGDEAQNRINAYSEIENKIKNLKPEIPDNLSDAFFQLAYYPVVCASYMNKKFLYADKAEYYNILQKRHSSDDYLKLSVEAFENIKKETDSYNKIGGGKWNLMMDYAPRRLSAYYEPVIKINDLNSENIWKCMPEGYVNEDSCLFDSNDEVLRLPDFSPSGMQKHFIDIYLTSPENIEWKAETSEEWVEISNKTGKLDTAFGNKEKRIWVSIDWNRLSDTDALIAPDFSPGTIKISAAGITKTIEVTARKYPEIKGSKFVESNGLVSIKAENYSDLKNSGSLFWKKIEGFGHAGNSFITEKNKENSNNSSNSYLEYTFYSFSDSICNVILNCIPVHPVNNNHKLRLGISVDDSPIQTVDLTTYGRSEEWKQNVLNNLAKKTIAFSPLKEGYHTLKVYAIDPGVILDHIIIDLGGHISHYGVIEETRIK